MYYGIPEILVEVFTMAKNVSLYGITFRCASDVEMYNELSAETIDFQTQFKGLLLYSNEQEKTDHP